LTNGLLVCLLLILFMAWSFLLISKKNTTINYLIFGCILSWILYYGIVKTGIYSYGVFGFRWGLFLIPLWLVAFITSAKEFVTELENCNIILVKNFSGIFTYFIIILTSLYCIIGAYAIFKHWEKENTKGIVQKWYEIKGYNDFTILSYGAKFGFFYYLKHNKNYHHEYLNNVSAISWLQEVPYKEYEVEITRILNNKFDYPVIYFCFAHTFPDVKVMLKVFEDKGYKCNLIYHSYDGYIYKLDKLNYYEYDGIAY
ncbi:MAG: hypothetical protein PHN72_07085, partial [Bacilli bacterium]|nr:hypothetical protein [Bacilli bacterium]